MDGLVLARYKTLQRVNLFVCGVQCAGEEKKKKKKLTITR